MAGYDIESMNGAEHSHWDSNNEEQSTPLLVLENNLNLQKEQTHRNTYHQQKPLKRQQQNDREPHHWDT